MIVYFSLFARCDSVVKIIEKADMHFFAFVVNSH